LQLIVAQFHFDEIDTSDLLIERNRAAVEVPIRYRHRETGVPFVSTKANFWTLEDGRPVKFTEYQDIA
jgi:ketosteroid isomerase-like protein